MKFPESKIRKIEFDTVETAENFYIASSIHDRKKFLFDGVEAKESFNNNWAKIPKNAKVQEKLPDKKINKRWALIDESLASEKIPKQLPYDIVSNDEYGDTVWPENFKHLESLYEVQYDLEPAKMVDVDVKYNVTHKVDYIKETEFEYPFEMNWGKMGKISESAIRHELVDTIIFPDILLPNVSSSLNSKQTYDIIRAYIKSHIDKKWAKVVSDYDFCFRVVKRIPLCEKESYKVDVNNSIFGKRKRKPRYETKYRTHRNFEVFDMCHKPYQNYSVIEAFTGSNHEDLKNNIETFLTELMNVINRPLEECKHCKGHGVVEVKT